MKTASVFSFAKNVLVTFSAACTLACIALSCTKSASSTSSPSTSTVTEADAAEVVTDAVVPASSGMVTQVNTATVMAASSAAYTCGTSYDSSIAGASITGAAVTWAYNLAWGWKFTCANPASFSASFKGSSSYTAVRMSSSDSSNGSFTITGTEPVNSAWAFNSSYTRNGSQQSYIGNKNKFTSTLTITSSDIKVSKATEQIISGTAAITISGTSSSGNSFSFSGTITFNGGKTATLVISGGGTYQITW